MGLREKLRLHIPKREQILNNRWVAWLGPWLHQPKLWHWSRRSVALGVALGVFFGLLIPIAQIPLSVAAAVVLRANIPAAAASTMVTNPITFGPIYYVAYQMGAWVTGDKESANPQAAGTADVSMAPTTAEEASLWARVTALGRPLLVGLSITAVLTGLATYVLITLIWRWRILSKRRNRRARQ
jgi:uncharacterized protein (DUF2062 family)